MENADWLMAELQKMTAEQPRFIAQALLADTVTVVSALDKRLSDMNGELDGRTWNPANW